MIMFNSNSPVYWDHDPPSYILSDMINHIKTSLKKDISFQLSNNFVLVRDKLYVMMTTHIEF